MWDVSERFLTALTGSHEIVTEVDVWRAGVPLETSIPVVSGTVSVDETSQVRRSLTLELGDPNLQPSDANSLLSPFGTELKVRTGIRYPEGDIEMVPVGVFGVENVSRSGWLEGVSITASDRARLVGEYRLLQPLKISADYLTVDYIAQILAYVNTSWEVYDLTGSSEYTVGFTVENDRWEAIEMLADSIGSEVYFDVEGVAIIREVPGDLTGPPAWVIKPGETGTLGDYSAALSREGVYNAVVAVGEATEDAVAPYVFIFQKTGPFRWGGPFGKVPRFYSSPLLQTVDQARLAAKAILTRSSGFAQRIIPTCVRNPALDAGDLIHVILPDGSTFPQIVSKFSFSLGPDDAGMTLETRTSADPDEAEDLGGM